MLVEFFTVSQVKQVYLNRDHVVLIHPSEKTDDPTTFVVMSDGKRIEVELSVDDVAKELNGVK
jgi:hypothetical protein